MKNKEQPSKTLALLCAQAAIEKKSNHNLIFEVAQLKAFTDYFLITSGTNERQVQAIVDEIVRQAKLQNHKPIAVEGYEGGRWVLVDFGDVVVHVFHDYIREFYNLEELWSSAPRVQIPVDFYMSPHHESQQPTRTTYQA